MNPQHDAGLDQLQALGRFEGQIGQIVGDVLAVFIRAADGDRLQGGHPAVHRTHRGRVNQPQLVELDPQQLQDAQGLVPGDAPGLQILFVIGAEQVVQAHADPQRGVLQVAHQMDEVEKLDGLHEGLRRMGRHPAAGAGDLFENLLAAGVGFGGRRFLGQRRIAAGKGDDRLQRYDDRLQEMLLLDVIHRNRGADLGDPLPGLCDQPVQAHLEQFLVIGNAQLGQLAPEKSAFIVPIGLQTVGQSGLVAVAHGLALPVRAQLVQLLAAGRVQQGLAGLAVGQAPGGFPVLVDGMIDPVGIGGLVADDALILPDEDPHLVEDIGQGLGPAQHHGLTVGLFERLGHQARALQVQTDFRPEHAALGIVIHRPALDVADAPADDFLA